MKLLNLGLSVILSLAYPLPEDLLEEEERRITTTKRIGSTQALLSLIFKRCAYAGLMGIITKSIVDAFIHQFRDELEVIEDFVEVCINRCIDLVQALTGNKKAKASCANSLPEEMWRLVGKRLVSRLDILRFRSVSRGCRSSIPCPTRFPISVPPPPNCDPEFLNVPYLVTEVTLYGCKGRQLAVAIEEVDQGGKFRGCYLRPWKEKCDFRMISFTDPKHRRSKLSFLGKGYRFRMRNNLEEISKFVNRIAIICSNEDGVNPSYVRASDLSVVAHLSYGEMEGRLALLRLGGGANEDRHWETGFCDRVFESIGSCKGKLFALDPLGQVFTMDYYSLQMTEIGAPMWFSPSPDWANIHPPRRETERKHLFESRGEMYVVNEEHFQFQRSRRYYEAYKLDFRRRKWIYHRGHMGKQALALAPYCM